MERTFGKYRLTKQLGGGRLSQVYRVGPRIALKRVNPALITEPAFVALVVREAGLLSRLDHPNLCTILEMGVVDGCPFLTLDLVDGCTLRALLRHASRLGIKLPTSAVVSMGYQLASVLEYLHGAPSPIAHLDLSPQNVMLSREGELKLIDFGIARYVDGHDPPPLGGRVAGTVGYMAPEQARGETFMDTRADQFGVGVLLWEMLAGRRLYRGAGSEIWRRMCDGDLPDLRAPLHDRPVEVVQIVERLLQPNAEHRFSTLAEALAAFDACTSSTSSGRRPIAALVSRLMSDASFDPFDAVNLRPDEPLPSSDIPTGAGDDEAGYHELRIFVDDGEDTPVGRMRAVVPAFMPQTESPAPLIPPPGPLSPFVENLGDQSVSLI